MTQRIDRRDFLRLSLAVGAAGMTRPPWQAPELGVVVDDFDRPDSYYHGAGWESLNPGYWQIKNHALRRRLKHRGDDRPTNWFPWHWETQRDKPMPIHTDPSLPFGMIFRRDWKLSGGYTAQMDAVVSGLPPNDGDHPDWKRNEPGYGTMGIAFGSKCLHESWAGGGESGEAAWMACWRDDGRFGIYDHATNAPKTAGKDGETPAPALQPGDEVTIEVDVAPRDRGLATVTATLLAGPGSRSVILEDVDREAFTDGYFGLVARGLLDFAVTEVRLEPGSNQPLYAPVNDLHVSYALGNTLRKENGRWRCRFMALFRSEGEEAAIRIADTPNPAGGWKNVPAAGKADIITNGFRRSTAVIEVVLPASPAETVLYYTVWKDGSDVTADPRIGTNSVGPGTGFVGQVPSDGSYVGRLPQLKAPYRLCGLSCHRIVPGGSHLHNPYRFQTWWLIDQSTPQAYEHLENYDFQVMLWEDDAWYLEVPFPPSSTDDAYKGITSALAGPTTRWQMMRHWNVLNPGDHEYGMDDVKGPEQIIIRRVDGLGQDPEYMRRNFQIVGHLTRGDENPSGTSNPKRWRRWQMPNGDFSLLILDGRLWRTSQDTNIWDDEGWGHKENLYSRTNPTRALLGEEQFAWLQEMIRTDAAPLVALTGINGLHTVWQGSNRDSELGQRFPERDRIAADYAGWVKAGADRVLELLGSRQGVVTVYGDVHLGCIMKNLDQGVYESCFGPIGPTGTRAVKPGFGRQMKDYDRRPLKVHALYHRKYRNPELEPIRDPEYWNFMEMEFDPRGEEPAFQLKIRNLIDAPARQPRGGDHVEATANQTGRPPSSQLPSFKTLPEAAVLITREDGTPVRGTRALPDGTVPATELIDVAPNTPLVVTARTAGQAEAEVLTTRSV